MSVGVSNDYSPAEALDFLIRKIEGALPQVADRIRHVVDAGVVEEVSEPVVPQRRSKRRSYQKARPYTDQEALHVLVNVLENYFVELPACIESANLEFAEAVGDPTSSESQKAPIRLQVEVVPETAKLQPTADGILPLTPPTAAELDEQRQNLIRLRKLVTFD